MKHFKKILALALSLIMCFGITTMSASAAESNITSTQSDIVGSIVISNTSTGKINSSGSTSTSISAKASELTYRVLPDTSVSGSTNGLVSITLNGITYQLKRDGVIHKISLFPTLPKGTVSITWNGANAVHYISLTFAG